jgi:HD-GYP domain-containing protein (c-di-GMP phosphodiesterase class II)
MTIADIYDALVAWDRPYKKAVSPERALEILGYESKAGKIDGHLFQVFVEARVFDDPDFRAKLRRRA